MHPRKQRTANNPAIIFDHSMPESFKPYILLGITTVLFLILFIVFPYKLVDLHIKDNFFVFTFSEIFLLLATFHLLVFLLHYLFTRKLQYLKSLSRLNIIFTLFLTGTFIILLFNASRAYSPTFSNWDFFEINNNAIILNAGLIITIQIVFFAIINWNGLTRKK